MYFVNKKEIYLKNCSNQKIKRKYKITISMTKQEKLPEKLTIMSLFQRFCHVFRGRKKGVSNPCCGPHFNIDYKFSKQKKNYEFFHSAVSTILFVNGGISDDSFEFHLLFSYVHFNWRSKKIMRRNKIHTASVTSTKVVPFTSLL